LKANDSLECRNCHSSVAMDFTKQTRRAAEIHSRYLITRERTCIDCHKGIAHELPDMTGVEPGWRAPPETQGERSSSHDDRETLRSYLINVGQ
jgi:cytochrome c-type protein NapC